MIIGEQNGTKDIVHYDPWSDGCLVIINKESVSHVNVIGTKMVTRINQNRYQLIQYRTQKSLWYLSCSYKERLASLYPRQC